jgi:hypothetical protein
MYRCVHDSAADQAVDAWGVKGLYAATAGDQAKRRTKTHAHRRGPRISLPTAPEKISHCRTIHRKCTIHPQLFNSGVTRHLDRGAQALCLDAPRRPTYS